MIPGQTDFEDGHDRVIGTNVPTSPVYSPNALALDPIEIFRCTISWPSR